MVMKMKNADFAGCTEAAAAASMPQKIKNTWQTAANGTHERGRESVGPGAERRWETETSSIYR